MNTVNFYAAIWLAFVLIAQGAQADPLFFDSFESSDMSKTNQDGFDWGRNNWTAIVTKDAFVYANGDMYKVPSGSPGWDPMDGAHALHFQYPPNHNMTEQRFSLGGAYPELWFSYWIKVPENFEHPVVSPSNNKFFATWMDGYSSKGNGPTVFWNILSNKLGGSNIAVSYSDGNYTVAGKQLQSTPFIQVPDDRGRWMKVIIYLKASTEPGTGEIGFWRRWEEELRFTKLHELTGIDLAIPPDGPKGWANGYIMGWANAPYLENTEWLLDSFTVSLDSLLGDGAAVVGSKPNPPKLNLE